MREFGFTVLFFSCDEFTQVENTKVFFVLYHVYSNYLIFKDEGFCFQLPDSSTCFSEFELYLQRFHRELELYIKTIHEAEIKEWYITVFSTYITLFGHLSSCLELLLFGRHYQKHDLHERLIHLGYYLPELASIFVKVSPQKLYLIDILYAVYKCEQADDSNLEIQLLNGLKIASERLERVCEELFENFKKQFTHASHPSPKVGHEKKHREGIEFWEPLIQHPKVEAIYEFRRMELLSPQGEPISLRFGLIVGESIIHSQLMDWHHRIKQQTEGKIEIIPIAHSRIWIQKELFEFQSFFLRVMQADYLLYERNSYLPYIHWLEPFEESNFEMEFYLRYILKLYDSYKYLRAMDDTSSIEGLGLLYSSVLIRSCRILIFKRLSYYPNALPFIMLWRLCQMADERVVQLHYLISKLRFDFLSFVIHHQNVYRPSQPILKEEWKVLDEILEVVIGAETT